MLRNANLLDTSLAETTIETAYKVLHANPFITFVKEICAARIAALTNGMSVLKLWAVQFYTIAPCNIADFVSHIPTGQINKTCVRPASSGSPI